MKKTLLAKGHVPFMVYVKPLVNLKNRGGLYV